MNLFSEFTNLYELSKTLRFELKPVGKTQAMLEENEVFEKDQIRKDKYERVKPYFDRLHREFVKDALEDAKLSDLDKYYEALKNVKKITRETSSKDKKAWETALENEEKRLRKEIVELFNATARIWATEKYSGLKNEDLKILDEEAVFSAILKERYGQEDGSFLQDDKTKEFILDEDGKKISIFDEWKNFTGYFSKFFETRRNFYKDDGTSTALATRIIDQNLRRFCDNLEVFNKIKDKVDFSEVEHNFGKPLSEVFSLKFYSQCLLQGGIDFYNTYLGGDSKDQNKKGLNQHINLHKEKTGDPLPFFKTLDKQILSEKEKFIDEIESDDRLKEVLDELLKTGGGKVKVLKNLVKVFVNEPGKFDLNKIYFGKKGFETISRKWVLETQKWEDSLGDIFNENGKKLAKKKDAGYSFPDFIPLRYIKKSLESLSPEDQESFWKDKYEVRADKIWDQFLEIFKLEFDELFEKTLQADSGEKTVGYDIFERELREVLESEKLEKTPEVKATVKNFADSLLSVYQFSKYFAVEKSKKWDDSVDLDDEFYHHSEYGFLDKYYQGSFAEIITPYNLLRNYLTKKPWEEVQKWKLNFENPTLADGWDKNKETDNFAVILRKDGKYFLGLMRKGYNQLFTDKNKDKFAEGAGHGSYEKMLYKFFPDQAKMFPKVCFSKKGREFFKPNDEIVRIYENGEFKKGDTFSVSSMQKLIAFYKDCLTKYEGWQCYDFKHLKPTENYTENIGEFYSDVAKDGYKISFKEEIISDNYIREKNESGELYLFQIYNKDFELDESIAPKNYIFKGRKTPNLHTIYFENLFSDENIAKNFIFKLNGQAEVFYRPQAIEGKKVKRNFKREITEKKRYTENKVFFHVPMTLNRGKGASFYFNRNINKFLANNPDINIIGIDRGEKHLAYYSVINQKEEILESGTLNKIENVDSDGNPILLSEKEIQEIRNDKNEIANYELQETGKKVPYTDYKLLLDYKEKKRKIERQTWQAVEGIKDLKKGYISQVVRKLADLAIQYNAIIVFEDLNMRFKQIRGGIEKSVYQQLEKALIEKLNFLVNKGETNPEKAGHLLRAYQLAAPFTTFKEMGKQTGIIFYTTASYTSKIDPITGWRPNLYLKNISARKNKENILKFSGIEFRNGRFEFTYDLRDFINSEKAKYPKKTEWIVCSSVERFFYNRKLNNNKGGYEYYRDLTDNFKKLFEDFGVDASGNILQQIRNIDENEKKNARFFSQFIFLFKLICQIRNTNPDEKGNDHDFILSPVEPFFDSRKDNGANLPKNGDDNGAFNIAKKGVVLLERISDFENMPESEKQKLKYPDLFITNAEWDAHITKSGKFLSSIL